MFRDYLLNYSDGLWRVSYRYNEFQQYCEMNRFEKFWNAYAYAIERCAVWDNYAGNSSHLCIDRRGA